jgi:hypothetical protein
MTIESARGYLLVATLLLAGCEPAHVRQDEPTTNVGAASSKQLSNSEDGRTAIDVMTRVAEQYAKCANYSDTGRVECLYTNTKKLQLKIIEFTTTFERGKRFRLEWSLPTASPGPLSRHVVSHDVDGTKSWESTSNELGTATVERSLGLVLARWTGSSNGVTQNIPALLSLQGDAEVGGVRLTEWAELEMVEDGVINEDDCYRLRSGSNYLWIDKQHFLVRRIEAKRNFPDFTVMEITTYTPSTSDK